MKKVLVILISGLAAALFATESIAADLWGIDIHGFIASGFLSSAPNDVSGDTNGNSFEFNEVGINFGKELTDSLLFGVQLFARDFSNSGDSDIKIDWAVIDYRYNNWLGVRLGQIKQPHGLYNEVRDIDMLRNPIFLPESVYHDLTQDLYVQDVYLSLQGAASRDLYLSLQGVSLYGLIDLDAAGGLSYQVMYGTQKIDPNPGTSEEALQFLSAAFAGSDESYLSGNVETEDIEVDYKYAGSLMWDTPLAGLRLGASLDNIKMAISSRFTEAFVFELNGAPSTLANPGDLATADYEKLQNWVGSIEYTWNDLVLMAEAIKTYKEYELSVGNFHETVKSDPWGWYVGAVQRLTDWLELGGYYSQSKNKDIDLTTLLPPIDYFLEFNDICATLRFDVNEYITLKLEAHHFSGDYTKMKVNINNPDYDIKEESWNLYAAKATVAF